MRYRVEDDHKLLCALSWYVEKYDIHDLDDFVVNDAFFKEEADSEHLEDLIYRLDASITSLESVGIHRGIAFRTFMFCFNKQLSPDLAQSCHDTKLICDLPKAVIGQYITSSLYSEWVQQVYLSPETGQFELPGTLKDKQCYGPKQIGLSHDMVEATVSKELNKEFSSCDLTALGIDVAQHCATMRLAWNDGLLVYDEISNTIHPIGLKGWWYSTTKCEKPMATFIRPCKAPEGRRFDGLSRDAIMRALDCNAPKNDGADKISYLEGISSGSIDLPWAVLSKNIGLPVSIRNPPPLFNPRFSLPKSKWNMTSITIIRLLASLKGYEPGSGFVSFPDFSSLPPRQRVMEAEFLSSVLYEIDEDLGSPTECTFLLNGEQVSLNSLKPNLCTGSKRKREPVGKYFDMPKRARLKAPCDPVNTYSPDPHTYQISKYVPGQVSGTSLLSKEVREVREVQRKEVPELLDHGMFSPCRQIWCIVCYIARRHLIMLVVFRRHPIVLTILFTFVIQVIVSDPWT